ncbi:MAG: hypothetical protein F6K10_01160 [Moorea sp. SIO2B7]|nr:hypothetical protein [Moorena sp. SIO2B7]
MPVFGLIRTDALRETSLIAPYYGSDKLLLAELSLRGRFQEIPEYLFCRRCHSNQSSRLSPEEREIWISPKAAMRPKILRNRGSIGFFKAILKAQLDWNERTSCFKVLIDYLLASNSWKHFLVKKTPTKVEEKFVG